MEEITAAYVRRLLPRRDPMGHKGTFGKVLCVCGSVGFSGAAVFAGRAAVRTGSGLVYLGVPEPVWPVAAMKCDEVMPFPLPSEEGKLSPLAEEAIRQRAGGCDAAAWAFPARRFSRAGRRCAPGRGWYTWGCRSRCGRWRQ